MHAVARVVHDRPAPDAPRAAAPADVRRARRARRRGHARRSCSPTPGYVTQAVGKWHMGENARVAAAERRLRRLLRLPLACPTCTPSGATRTSSPRSSTARSARAGSRTCRSTSASCTRRAAATLENVEEVTIPVLSLLDDKWADYSLDFIRRMGEASDAALVPLPLHARRALRQLPARALPRLVAGQAPVQGHDHRARRHRRPAGGRARGDRPARGHADLHLVRQRARDGDVARRRVLAVPQREGIDLGGRPARARHRRRGRG